MADTLETTSAPAAPQKAEAGLMERLFQGTDNWDSFLSPEAASGVRNALAGSTDEKGDKMRMANTAFLADAFGKSPDEVAPLYEQYRDSWAQQILGKDAPQMDDAAFYGAIGKHLQQQKAETFMLQRVSAGMLDAFKRGQNFDEAFSKQQADNQWLDSWNDDHADAYREMQRAAWDEMAARGQRLQAEIDDATDYFNRARARSMTSNDQRIMRDRLTDMLIPLSPEDRQFVLGVAATGAEQQTPQKEGGNLLERLKRGTEAFGGQLVRGALQVTEGTPFTTSETVLRNDVSRLIDERVSGEVDPARADSVIANGFLATAESLPKILSSLNPVGVAALAIASKDEARSALMSRGVGDAEANALSTLVAVPETALQFVSGRMLLGDGANVLAKPIMEEAQLTGAALVKRTLVNLGIEAPAFVGVSEAANLTPLAVQAVASTLDKNVPGVSFAEFAAAAKEPLTPEGLASLAPLLIFAAGAGTFHDRAAGLAYVQDATRLRAAGYSESVVRDVLAAKSPEDAQLILRLNKPELGTERQSEGIASLEAETNTLPGGYRFEQTDEHGLLVYDDRGFPVGSARSPEMAARIAQDHAAERNAPAEELIQEQQKAATPEERLRQSFEGARLLREELAKQQQAGIEEAQGRQNVEAEREAAIAAELQARLAETVSAAEDIVQNAVGSDVVMAIVPAPARPSQPGQGEFEAATPVPAGMSVAEVRGNQVRLRAVDRKLARLDREAGKLTSKQWARRRSIDEEQRKLALERLDLQAKSGNQAARTALEEYHAEVAAREGVEKTTEQLTVDFLKSSKIPTVETLREVGSLASEIQDLELPGSWFSKRQKFGLDRVGEQLDEFLASHGDPEAIARREEGRTLTEGEVVDLIANAARHQAQNKTAVETLPAVPRIEGNGETFASRASRWADKVIGEGRLFSGGTDPELFAAYMVKGAELIARGARDFAVWSREMVRRFGESISAHLNDIFDAAQRHIANTAEGASPEIRDAIAQIVQATPAEFKALGGGREGLTGYAYELGLKARTPADVEALKAGATQANEESRSLISAGDVSRFDEAMVASTKAQILREAYEAATGEGSAGKFLRESRPDYVPPVPMGALEQPVPESGYLSGSRLEKWADRTIAQGRVLSGIDPELLAAFAVKGAAVLERGIRDFGKWSAAMVKQFGESIRPHLESIYREALGRVPAAAAPGGPTVKLPDTVIRVPEAIFKAGTPATPGQVEKLLRVLKEAKPLIGQTEHLYHRERARRAARMSRILEGQRGEGAIGPLKGAMAGELPRVDIEPIRGQFTAKERDAFFEHIQTHDSLEGMVYTKAQLSIALQALLNHGSIPTRGNLALFEKVFSPAFAQELLAKRSRFEKFADMAKEILNAPRTLVSSYDLSASLRQGFTLAVSHPEVAKDAFLAQLRAFADGDYARSMDKAFRAGPKAEIRDNAGLELPSFEAGSFGDREERFMSHLLQQMAKVPGVSVPGKLLQLHGRGIKASERAYVTYLNKLRVEVFDMMDAQLQRAGLDDATLAKERKFLAKFINAATGRGNVRTEPWVNALLFSPKFMVSRFEYPMRAVQGLFHAGPLRTEAIRQLVAQAFVWSSFAALGAAAASAFGWDIQFGANPREPDFLKFRLGEKTTVDTGAGFGQVARLVSRIVSRTAIDQHGRKSKADIVDETGRFLRYKLAPIPSVVVDIQQGKQVSGKPVTVGGELVNLVVPIPVQTMVDAVNEHGAKGLFLMIPDTLGMGVQVYNKPEKAVRAPRQAEPNSR